MLKLAIYTICKNEIQNIAKYLNNAFQADYICILDTGSTDGSFELLKELSKKDEFKEKLIVEQKVYNPWRFDSARNDNLKMVPKDTNICWELDLDETAEADSVKTIKEEWEKYSPNQLEYKYAWRVDENDNPLIVFWYNKIHDCSENWYWKFPIHETLTYCGKENLKTARVDKLLTKHHPLNKDRGDYTPLLEMRVKDYPDDYCGKIYLIHQYNFIGRYSDCILFAEKIKDDIKDPLFKSDLLYYEASSYEKLNQIQNAINKYEEAILTYNKWRDPYFNLAYVYYTREEYEEAVEILLKMLRDTKRLYSWLEIGKGWSFESYDLLSICFYKIGQKEEALNFEKIAQFYCAKTNSEYSRIENNIVVIQKELDQQGK